MKPDLDETMKIEVKLSIYDNKNGSPEISWPYCDTLLLFRSSVEMTVQNGATIFTISIILTTRWQKTIVLSPVLYTVGLHVRHLGT